MPRSATSDMFFMDVELLVLWPQLIRIHERAGARNAVFVRLSSGECSTARARAERFVALATP
jgi:hypothetical protein